MLEKQKFLFDDLYSLQDFCTEPRPSHYKVSVVDYSTYQHIFWTKSKAKGTHIRVLGQRFPEAQNFYFFFSTMTLRTYLSPTGRSRDWAGSRQGRRGAKCVKIQYIGGNVLWLNEVKCPRYPEYRSVHQYQQLCQCSQYLNPISPPVLIEGETHANVLQQPSSQWNSLDRTFL